MDMIGLVAAALCTLACHSCGARQSSLFNSRSAWLPACPSLSAWPRNCPNPAFLTLKKYKININFVDKYVFFF